MNVVLVPAVVESRGRNTAMRAMRHLGGPVRSEVFYLSPLAGRGKSGTAVALIGFSPMTRTSGVLTMSRAWGP